MVSWKLDDVSRRHFPYLGGCKLFFQDLTILKKNSAIKDLAGCLLFPNNIRFNLALFLHCQRALNLTFPFRPLDADYFLQEKSNRLQRVKEPSNSPMEQGVNRVQATMRIQTSRTSSDCERKARGSRPTRGMEPKAPSILRAGDKGNSARAGTGRGQREVPGLQPGTGQEQSTVRGGAGRRFPAGGAWLGTPCPTPAAGHAPGVPGHALG